MGLFEEINVHLASLGHRLKTGTIVDASIIDAPSSTKNRRGERDPEMHQTKKGNKGENSGTSPYRGRRIGSGAQLDDGRQRGGVTQACVLLHGDETEACDAGYQQAPGEQGLRRRLAGGDEAGQASPARSGRRRGGGREAQGIRAKVEHPFLYVKRRFGYGKVRYRGLAKNTQRIALLLGFSNLLIAGRYATG